MKPYRVVVARKSWPFLTYRIVHAFSERDASYSVTRNDGDVVAVLSIQHQ